MKILLAEDNEENPDDAPMASSFVGVPLAIGAMLLWRGARGRGRRPRSEDAG